LTKNPLQQEQAASASSEHKTEKAGRQGRPTRQADKAGRQGRPTRQADKADKAGRQGRPTRQADKEGGPTRQVGQQGKWADIACGPVNRYAHFSYQYFCCSY